MSLLHGFDDMVGRLSEGQKFLLGWAIGIILVLIGYGAWRLVDLLEYL